MMMSEKFYITNHERNLIASTPPKECWICDMFSTNVFSDHKGFYLPEEVFEDYGIVEHLEQIINREVDTDDLRKGL